MHWAWEWAARRGGAETVTRASRDASEARSEVAARSLLSELLLQPLEFIYLISIAGLFQINILIILDILTLTLLLFFFFIFLIFLYFLILSLYFSPWPGWGAKTWHQGHGLGWTRSALPWGCCACSNFLSLPIAAAVLHRLFRLNFKSKSWCEMSQRLWCLRFVFLWCIMYSISCNLLFSPSYLGHGLGSKRRENSCPNEWNGLTWEEYHKALDLRKSLCRYTPGYLHDARNDGLHRVKRANHLHDVSLGNRYRPPSTTMCRVLGSLNAKLRFKRN